MTAKDGRIYILRHIIYWAALTGAIFVGGCAQPLANPVPTTLEAYRAHRQTTTNGYPDQSIALQNLQRVLDPDLPADQRIASLVLVVHLDGDNPAHHPALATVLDRGKSTPEPVRMAVLQFLVRKDYSNIAPHVVAGLTRAQSEEEREALVDWLTRHPQTEVLAEVVKLWAQADPQDAETEQRYRRAVETMAGRTWSDALLDGLNQQGFFARGSAMKILASRVPPAELRRRLAAMNPRSTAVLATQFYLTRADYLPTSPYELLAAVMTYSRHRQDGRLTDALEQARQWRQSFAYRFHIRDFHLLSRLKADHSSILPGERELVRILADRLASRSHLRPGGALPGGAKAIAQRLRTLDIADLTAAYLVDEMLSRQDMQLQLTNMAINDRADQTSAWGGLITYREGQAVPQLYSPRTLGDDVLHSPSPLLQMDAIDALAYFHNRFGDAAAQGAFPTSREMQLARELPIRHVLLTGAGEEYFSAVVYDSNGMMLSLGLFPYAR